MRRGRSSSPSRRGHSRQYSSSACTPWLQPRAGARSWPPPSPTGATSAGDSGELAELARQTGAPLVATADALYHHPARRPLADVLTCIGAKCTIAEAGYRLEANAERHLKPAAEMARLFADYPQAVARTAEIAQRIAFDLSELRYEYPDEPVPPGKTPQAYLEELTWTLAAERYQSADRPDAGHHSTRHPGSRAAGRLSGTAARESSLLTRSRIGARCALAHSAPRDDG